jgi:bacterioferritin-associated ferredoxin
MQSQQGRIALLAWIPAMNSFLPTSCEDCPDKIVCRCLQVTESQVVRMIERLELRTVHDIRQYTGAGDGCTCCHAKLRECLVKHACVEEAVVA